MTSSRIGSRTADAPAGRDREMSSAWMGATGYLDLGTARSFAIADLMPGGVRLMEYARVTAADSVLVVTARGVDPLVLQAIMAAAAARDASVHVLVVPAFSPGGAARSGHTHCDWRFDRPTTDVDGEPLVVDGHLLVLDEPAVREAAAAFGDAAALLDDEPVVPLPGP